MIFKAVILIVVMLCYSYNSKSFSLTDEFIKKELQSYNENPKEYSKKLSIKKNLKLNRKITPSQKRYFQNKVRYSSFSSTKSLPRENDLVSNLLRGAQIERNIQNLEKMNLNSGSVEVRPWSDDYWPVYKGVLGARYMDLEFSFIFSWKDAFDYVKERSAKEAFVLKSPEAINRLSPSEKFDLLLSADQFPLTNAMWAQGKYYSDNSEDGEVETWMGICHGWAAASYMVKRPQKYIEVVAFDGKTPIRFYPSDLKSLASLLWSSSPFQTYFIGSRCSQKDPRVGDDERILDQECFDTNPSSFHLALANGIGRYKRSFIMDATYDYEVWNQPIISYQYKYFDPISLDPTFKFKDAIVPIDEYQNDRFKNYRSSGVKFIVGISLEVEYAAESSPSHDETDVGQADSSTTAYYFYDLELDSNYNIIGGEWYNRIHPDFLWTPDYNTRAITRSDYYLLSRNLWDGKSALSQEIRTLATGEAFQGNALAYIVNSLIQLSQEK